jgi:hypothetical protein
LTAPPPDSPAAARDRILVWFRLPLLLLVAVTGYGVIGYRVVLARPTPPRCC